MPSKAKCKTGWKALGYKSMSDCASYGKKKMTQKPNTSVKDDAAKRGKDRAIAANSRMKKRLAKERSSY